MRSVSQYRNLPGRIAIGPIAMAGLIAASLSVSRTCEGQGVTRVIVGTPYSAAIFAQSDYLRSQGDFLTSAATARKLNAEAADMEMRNSVTWINTYFERRRLNRELRAAEHPGYLEKESQRYSQYRKLLNSSPKTLLEGDLTDDLNWMLRDFLAHSSYSLFMPGRSDSLLTSPANSSLNELDKHHIRLMEKGTGGKMLVFRADTAMLLETRWPMALRDDRFSAARTQFEAARDASLADLKAKRSIARDNEKRLMAAVDALSNELLAAYPTDRLKIHAEFLEFAVAKRYVQALAVGTYRLIQTQAEAAFDDSFRFRGDTVAALLEHMLTKGLEFAPPEPGDEAIYRRLFGIVRALYLEAVPNAEGRR